MRNNRVKKNKNRRKSMALAISLGLFLATGSAVGTWSYFTSKSEVNSSVKVTVGSLKTDFANPASGANIIEIKDAVTGDTKTSQFQIKNTGSLTQKVRLIITKDLGNNTVPTDALDDIQYTLDFKTNVSGGDFSKTYTGDMRDFVASKNDPNKTFVIDIKKQDLTPLYLKPGESITGTLTMNFNRPSDNGAKNKYFNFALKAIATQPNDDSWQ